ncbi:acetyl-CoA carboxylase biotin carboxylase subunit family protein [Aminobacter sp. BA135]|uniref:ATP-grasp domain-containing protein n=1 Tax=Aminobacter sp. BA135 TaxID=537596 RepID=UPI003D7AE9AD
MKRRALILIGGTRTNGPLYVQAARNLGLNPITMADDPRRHDYHAAEDNEVICVDTSNLDALICECARLFAAYDIAGITSSEEAAYATVGRLCRHFNLPGPNADSVERCCDKFTQRQLLAQADIPIPAYGLATNAYEVVSSAAEIGFPVIVKPATDTGGSEGVRLCASRDELIQHTAYILSRWNTRQSSPKILVEEFVKGSHYWVEMMGDDVIGIASLEFGPSPHFVYNTCAYPAVLTNEQDERISDVSLRCLQALDLHWGPTNVELRWTEQGPVVIEVNPRMSGSPGVELVELACGINLIREHIKLVIGDEGDLRGSRSDSAAAQFLVPERDGVLDWIEGVSRAAAIPGVAKVKLYLQPNTTIKRRGDHRDLIGYVTASSPDLARTEAILQRAVDLIEWSVA